MDTVLLFDNSLSVSAAGPEILELADELIDEHTDDEIFELYTSDTKLNEIASGTDYDKLKEAVKGITYQDQDNYLIANVDTLLEKLKKEKT